MKQEYQALARRYRPQQFAEVLGQEAIVTTLQNGLKSDHVAHAYLFSGARGTGKTTLARLLAKALNCPSRSEAGEPCGKCSSCKEIGHGNSLDVLEIDGASHRGIDDIRQVNETVGYAASGGGYKIYIVDEVHMLTKEAFNALLKTLEEPPAKVKFFFATTEPEKVPSTIISRCQRFHLSRLSPELIGQKLAMEAKEAGVTIDDAALKLIARASEGGMRDAESILDQVISFHGDTVDEASVASALGLVTSDLFARLDEAIVSQNATLPFELVDEVFSQGKDLAHFVESLIDHYRTHLLVKLGLKKGASPFTTEELTNLIDDLIRGQVALKTAPSKRVTLEMMLSRVVRMRHQVSLETLVQRLIELEGKLGKPAPAPKKEKKVEAPPPPPPKPAPAPKKETPKAKANPRHETAIRFAAVELEGRVQK